MCLILELITSNGCIQIWFVAKNFPQNINREYDINGRYNASIFEAPQSFGLNDSFFKLKHLCLTIDLVSDNEINSD